MVTVAVLDDQEPAAAVPRPGPGEIRVETMRGRGRGGQRKNKVETAVRVRHVPTGLTVTRSTGRSQSANIASARGQVSRELQAQAVSGARAQRNEQRRGQVARSPRARVFTHNAPRGRVTESRSGRTWDLRAWQQGRLS